MVDSLRQESAGLRIHGRVQPGSRIAASVFCGHVGIFKADDEGTYMDELITIKEAASILSVSARTVYRLLSKRRLTATMVTRDCPRICRSAVQRLIDESTVDGCRAGDQQRFDDDTLYGDGMSCTLQAKRNNMPLSIHAIPRIVLQRPQDATNPRRART